MYNIDSVIYNSVPPLGSTHQNKVGESGDFQFLCV